MTQPSTQATPFGEPPPEKKTQSGATVDAGEECVFEDYSRPVSPEDLLLLVSEVFDTEADVIEEQVAGDFKTAAFLRALTAKNVRTLYTLEARLLQAEVPIETGPREAALNELRNRT